MSGCQALRFEAVYKGKLRIPKDLVTQSSESLVRLTVYNQHFLVGLKTKVREQIISGETSTQWSFLNTKPSEKTLCLISTTTVMAYSKLTGTG